jgi:hypothetical protein
MPTGVAKSISSSADGAPVAGWGVTLALKERKWQGEVPACMDRYAGVEGEGFSVVAISEH